MKKGALFLGALLAIVAMVTLVSAVPANAATPTPTPPTICYSPSSLSFSASEGGANPPSQTLQLWNCGGGSLNWSVKEAATWLSLTPSSGTASTETDNVTVSVNISGMTAGSYDANITITASGATNSPRTVGVSLTITEAPSICASPSSLSFSAAHGGTNPSDQTLEIENCGGGSLNWSVSDDATWLSLSPSSGTTTAETDEVTVSVDITGMGIGSYEATITVSATGATNTPQTVEVSLTVTVISPVTGTVGTAEGWLETPEGRVMLHFPAGSFAGSTTVSIEPVTTCPEPPEGFSLGETCFSLSGGLRLLKPIDICVRASDADLAAAEGNVGWLKLAVYDEDTVSWELLGTSIDQPIRALRARATHLSTFAIIAGPGGGEFFSMAWWTVWWHVLPIGVGVIVVAFLAIVLWRRARRYSRYH